MLSMLFPRKSTFKPHAALQRGVLPDTCNFGVVLRVLLIVNLGALLWLMARMETRLNLLTEFALLSATLQPLILASLMAICGLRRWIGNWTPVVQRFIGCMVPVLCMLALKYWFAPWDGFTDPMTTFFPVLLTACISFLLLHYFELRARAFSPALTEARMQALQARIRPHFLFNSLNAVLGVVRDDPRRAEAMLEDLSDLFRALLRDARDQIPLHEELKLCKQYIAIEQIRLGNRLQIDWQIDDSTSAALIPSLLLQPLLENAIRHGVEQRAEHSQIDVKIMRKGDRVVLYLANPIANLTTMATGQPLSPTEERRNNHIALENIRQRLALFYDMEAQMEINLHTQRFEVVLNLPYQETVSANG